MMEMERSPFLPLPEGMVIGQVEITAAQLTVEVISTQPSARCPECGSPSDHVHCQYQRTVHDVPCGGRNVVLRLGVRKFARLHSDMPTKSFCRTPSRSGPALGTGEQSSPGRVESPGALRQWMPVSERLAPRLGMQVKAPTLLRYLRTIPSLSDEPVRVLGMDDFAIRRGDCYGTILVNLESGKPLDLLPDRTAEAVLPWLKDHQEIEIVSRDRASAYADAVKRALPHAIQVADRYHLVQNLREHLQRFLDRKRTCLPEVEDMRVKAVATSSPGSGGSLNDQIDQIGAVTSTVSAGSSQAERTDQPQEQVEPELPHALVGQEIELASLTYAERKKKISRDKRYARYEHMLALHRAGMSGRAIARALHMSRRIVQRYLSSDVFPERAPGSGRRAFGKSKLDPYLVYLRERWNEGSHSGSRLFCEIKERGYTGSESLLRQLLGEWRLELPRHSEARTTAQTTSLLSANETTPFLARRSLSDDLTTLKTYQGATATGGANEPQRVTPRRLLLEPGVCHHAQSTPGGGIGWVAQASKSVSRNRTGQLCQRDSSRLCCCPRCLLLTLE